MSGQKPSFLKMARAQGKVDRLDSSLEAEWVLQLRERHVRPWVRNHVFLPDRKLELDFAFPDSRRAVEVEGMAHRIKENFRRDIEKHALAKIAGWDILRVDGRTIRDGRGMAWFLQLWPDLVQQ